MQIRSINSLKLVEVEPGSRIVMGDREEVVTDEAAVQQGNRLYVTPAVAAAIRVKSGRAA